MRLLQVAGLLLIFGGAFVLLMRPSYPTRENVLRVGEFKATVKTEESIPLWIGGAGVGLGVVLLLVGSRRRE